MRVDLLLVGRVVDGSGGEPYDGWVAVQGDRITAVERAEVAAPEAAVVMGGATATVTPGFIDVHTHSDLSAVVAPSMESAVRQGVTTVVVGNCGSSPAPLPQPATAAELLAGIVAVDDETRWGSFGEDLDAVAGARPATNVAALVGLGALRRLVMTDPLRPATADEAEAMREQLVRALDEGAVGLSSGLIYDPDRHADLDELVTVASGLRTGVYASHVRGEGEHVLASVAEALAGGRRCDVPVQVSHIKCESSHAWGRMPELIELVRQARVDGVQAAADAYPYAAYETELVSFLPPWATHEELPALLASPRDRERLRTAVERGEPGWQSSVDGVGWERIVVDHHADRAHVGRDLASLADGGDPLDLLARLLGEDPSTFVIGHAMDEADVRLAIAAPDVMVASDGVAVPSTGPLAALTLHPRCWGTFPRVLGHYVREEQLLSLASAVRSMTTLPAEQFGLRGRGVLAVGAFADAVVIDAATVAGPADFGAAAEPPVGVDAVVVNGRLAWSAGQLAERAGEVLR